MICTPCMSKYYLCYFLENIDNKKLGKNDMANNDVYILYVKRYIITNYS
jgi:hypothetical protein